jgi:hypothetical protein
VQPRDNTDALPRLNMSILTILTNVVLYRFFPSGDVLRRTGCEAAAPQQQHHFIVIVGVQVAQSIFTLALVHSRVKIPLLGAVSLQTLSTGSP